MGRIRYGKRINYKLFILCIAFPLLVGAIAGFLTSGNVQDFKSLAKPPLAPPVWLFPVVWTLLYTLMGGACYLVCSKIHKDRNVTKALVFYGLQLFFNFFWSIIFFQFKWYFGAFFWLVILWALIGFTILAFRDINKGASWLLYPYFVWVTFAGYLNLGIAFLN